jgi:UDP-N-acetylmuramoyl-L-alanyl-D-glutamate--2,6-diaminopimelate ligase
MGEKCDLRAVSISLDKEPGHLGVSFKTKGLLTLDAKVPSPGRFSVYNALCAIAVCRHFGVPTDKIAEALAGVHVKGRIEMVKVSDDFTLMIDYAHNAVALESLLATLREYESGRLVCLFGCGGNRARSRRFEMGEVSGRLADLTIITSDNPRFEDPQSIIDQVKQGFEGASCEVHCFVDRLDAIKFAVSAARKGDMIALCGNGHEDYQVIGDDYTHFSEHEIIKELCG